MYYFLIFTVSLFVSNKVVVDDVGYASGPRLDISAYSKCYCTCVFTAVPYAVVVLFQGTSIYDCYEALNCELKIRIITWFGSFAIRPPLCFFTFDLPSFIVLIVLLYRTRQSDCLSFFIPQQQVKFYR